MKELQKFQSSTFDTLTRQKFIEDQNTIMELSGRLQELQNEVNCMNDSKDFQDAESVRSGNSHVTSQPLQLGYLGSDSCLMSSPPGLRDAFNEAGWTVVTRKARNRQQGSRRRGCSDKRGTVLGSLWDDDNDMILGQVADDRTKKGLLKISAVVDSGAEANALH